MRTYSFSAPHPIVGTLQFKKQVSGLGRHTDVNNVTWDICAIIGNTVKACRVTEMQSWYTDTSGNDSQYWSGTMGPPKCQTWLPYNFEIIQ